MERISPQSPSQTAGFTLLEILVVMVIIASLLVFAADGIHSSTTSLRLQGSAEAIRALAAQARQRAATTGHSHELRLYRWQQDETARFAWHLHELTGDGPATPTGHSVMLDESLLLVPELSSFFANGLPVQSGARPGNMPGAPSAQYVAITVHPSGATDLPEQPPIHHITFASREALAQSLPPKDFVTLVFEQSVLSVTLHRPGL